MMMMFKNKKFMIVITKNTSDNQRSKEERSILTMNVHWKQKLMKYSTVLGCMLLLFPSGILWYWGNMSVYSMSYYLVILNVTSGLDTPWILSTFLIFWTVGTTSSGFISRRIGRRLMAFIGIVIMDCGIFLGYLTNQTSLALLTITMGVMVGLGTGFVDSSGLQMVIDVADKDAGTLTSLVQGSMALGGFAINELITFFTNPKNLAPDYAYGETRYFTQKEVLEKVPKTYFVIGSFAIGSHILAFAFLLMKPAVNCWQLNTSYQEYNSESYTTNREDVKINDAERNGLTPKPKSNDLTPFEVLRTPSFYAIWLSFFFGEISLTSLVNYYKSFGQVWIKDDHFLTAVGTCFILFGAVSSFFAGIALEKLGVKKGFILYSALSAVVQGWYSLSPLPNKWIFAIATILSSCLGSLIFVSYLGLIAILYGKTHFTTNFGLLLTSQLLFNVIATFVMGLIVQLGWLALFGITSACSIIRMLLLVVFLPSST